MKKHYLFLDSCVLLSCLLAACSTEEYLTADTSVRYETANLTGLYLLQQMNEQENAYKRLQETAVGKTILYDYATTSFTTDYGTYYALPYRDGAGASINGCIIYPVDEELSLPQRKFSGCLGKPLDMDARLLNEEIPVERRFLYSTHFEQWEKQGLSVEKNMTEMAHLLRKGPVEVENGRVKEAGKSSRSVDEIGVHAEMEFYYRAGGQDEQVTVLPDGSYVWEITAYNDPYAIIEKCFKQILDASPLQILHYRYTDDCKGTVRLRFSSLRPMSYSELVDLGYLLTGLVESDLRVAHYDSYFSYKIIMLEGLLSGSGGTGDSSGGDSGGGGHSGGSGIVGGGGGGDGEGDGQKPSPEQQDLLKLDFIRKYLSDELINKVRDSLMINWDMVTLMLLDSRDKRFGNENASYNSMTNELIINVDRINKRKKHFQWTDEYVMSIIYHEYVHVKQKSLDGLVLRRDEKGRICKDEYKIYYGEQDLQRARDVLNEFMEFQCNNVTKEEWDICYEQRYKNLVEPVLEHIRKGEYYIVKENKDLVLSEIEAYEMQLSAFGKEMSPAYIQECEKDLLSIKQKYELIKNAEKQ